MKERIGFSKVENLVNKQNEHIPLFNNDTIEGLYSYLIEEMEELREVLEQDNPDYVELMSEIADVQYLLIRIAQMTNVDLIEGVISKVARNYKKYGKAETREEAKANWSHQKDHEFLNDWITVFREKQRKKNEEI